ncbi:MAG: class I SAM-dependent methyltransferase [Pseudomonadota bacterium]
MKTPEAFWNKLARKYAATPIKDEAAYETTLERTRAHLTSETKLLEIGCGTGSTALKLAGDVAKITASDVSSEMIAIANEKKDAASADKIIFVKGTVFDPQFDSTSPDVIIAFNLLHLVEDLDATLARVNALLPNDGLFISKTPCLAEKGSLLKLMIPLMQIVGKAPYVRFLGVDELKDHITNAGFDVVEVGDYPPKMPSRFVVARKH